MKLIIIVIVMWVKRLLGIKSPSTEILRFYAPIIKNEMDEYMAYTGLVIDALESEDETVKRLQE